MGQDIAFCGAGVFDGLELEEGQALLVRGGAVVGSCPADRIPAGYGIEPLGEALIAPGFVDLQVNGGGGYLFNDAPTVEGLARIAKAHLEAGTTSFLPTLVTDTQETTRAAVDAAVMAIETNVPGIVGLHLEGPHFSPSRKGAHRLDLLRPMSDDDLGLLLDTARRVPVLMVTLSPEVVAAHQIRSLADAGIWVSIGHSESGFEECRAAVDAGARLVTHLFNAMSQLGNREPGVVGAALSIEALHAGLIADGHHVHPANIALAVDVMGRRDRLFLVTDAMAPFGTDQTSFLMNGRRVLRRDGQLRLEDGTLAGADVTLPQALRNVMRFAGIDLPTALRLVTSTPARAIGAYPRIGSLKPGVRADFVTLSERGDLRNVYVAGRRAS